MRVREPFLVLFKEQSPDYLLDNSRETSTIDTEGRHCPEIDATARVSVDGGQAVKNEIRKTGAFRSVERSGDWGQKCLCCRVP